MARDSEAHRLSAMYRCTASYVWSRTRVLSSLRKSVFGLAIARYSKKAPKARRPRGSKRKKRRREKRGSMSGGLARTAGLALYQLGEPHPGFGGIGNLTGTPTGDGRLRNFQLTSDPALGLALLDQPTDGVLN